MRTPANIRLMIVALVAALALPTTAFAENDQGSETVLELSGDSHYDALIDRVMHPTNYRHRHRKGRIIRIGPPPRPRRHRHRRHNKHRRGSLYMGIGVLGNFFLETGEDASQVYRGGGGFDLMVGVRLSSFIALEVNYIAAFQSTQKSKTGESISDGSVQAISLDGKIFFTGTQSALQPFAQIGIGAYMLSELFKEQLTGVGMDLGGGVDIRLGSRFAIGLRVLYRGFYVDNSDNSYYKIATESAFLNTITAEANAQFHF